MHRSRILLLISAAAAWVAMPLPFVRFAGQGSVNGLDGYGWPAAAVLLFVAVLALIGDRAESLGTITTVSVVAATGLAIVLAAFKLADAAQAADAPQASIGAGPWVLLGATVLGMAGALASLTRRI